MLGTVEVLPNACAVVFEVIGSETVVVLLDGFAVETVIVAGAGVVNVVSGGQCKKIWYIILIKSLRIPMLIISIDDQMSYLAPIGMFAI